MMILLTLPITQKRATIIRLAMNIPDVFNKGRKIT